MVRDLDLAAVLGAGLDAMSVLRIVRDDAGVAVDLEVLEVNEQAESLIRRPRSELVGARVTTLLGPAEAGRLVAVAAAVERGAPLDEEVPTVVPGTPIEWVRHRIAPVAPDTVAMSTRDVTPSRLQAMEEAAVRRIALTIAEGRGLQEVLSAVAAEAVTLLSGGEAAVVRLADREVLGHAPGTDRPDAELVANGAVAAALELRRPVHADALAAAAVGDGDGDGPPWGVLVVRPRADGTLRESAVPRLGALADLARLAVVNADARAHAELLARTDELTGLPNRRAFTERLPGEVARALRAGSPLALAALDLDRFKRVNDRHGHAVGDQVLAAVAEALRGTVREGELLARVGGEEFAWILPACGHKDALVAAERARRAVAAVEVPGVARSTISVGIGLLAADGDAEQLQRDADRALYRAKSGGRDRVEVEEEAEAAPHADHRSS